MPDNINADTTADDENQKELEQAEAQTEHQKKLDQADELITIILPTINNNK